MPGRARLQASLPTPLFNSCHPERSVRNGFPIRFVCGSGGRAVEGPAVLYEAEILWILLGFQASLPTIPLLLSSRGGCSPTRHLRLPRVTTISGKASHREPI